jgi:putative DNA primase/helicase
MLALAQNILPISDAGDAWDLDPWLLGVPNGVVDLKTGTLRAGRPEDRITMRARVAFDPDALCPLYDKAVSEIFEDRMELIDYFDRYAGYSLTGDCREESLWIGWGPGGNGKGVLMNTIAYVFGDYADDLPFSAFELQSRAGIPNDIAKIVGKRFVTASETIESVRLNEARIKALTGRDPITARFLHKEFFTFQPVAKFWLAANHKPDVRDDSEGFWRRVHLVPFTASFVGREDMTLKDRLREEAAGILARTVRGCLAWQKKGLAPPIDVREATKVYRNDSKPLARFLDECCVVQDGARATFGDLFKAYVRWATNEPARMGRHEFSAALHARFDVDASNTQRVVFAGVGVLNIFAPEPGM